MNDAIKLASSRQPVFANSYGVAGSSGDLVVLLHCSMSHKGQWRELMRDLSPTHRLIAIDLMGYGDAPGADADSVLGLHDEARRVRLILRRIFGRIPAFHLVGHSYGGGVALHLARVFPHRVMSLSLYEPTAFHVLPDDDSARAEIAQIVAQMAMNLKHGARGRAAELFIDYWSGRGAYAGFPARLQTLLAGNVDKALLDFSALLNEPATLRDYAKLPMPVCLIGGRVSPTPSRRATAMLARTVARGELHWIDAGHMAPITHPENVNPIIARFLADSAVYFGVNPDARQDVREGNNPKRSERIAQTA